MIDWIFQIKVSESCFKKKKITNLYNKLYLYVVSIAIESQNDWKIPMSDNHVDNGENKAKT